MKSFTHPSEWFQTKLINCGGNILIQQKAIRIFFTLQVNNMWFWKGQIRVCNELKFHVLPIISYTHFEAIDSIFTQCCMAGWTRSSTKTMFYFIFSFGQSNSPSQTITVLINLIKAIRVCLLHSFYTSRKEYSSENPVTFPTLQLGIHKLKSETLQWCEKINSYSLPWYH